MLVQMPQAIVQNPEHAQETVEMVPVRCTSVELLPVPNTEPHDMSRALTQIRTRTFENAPTDI